MWVNLEKLRGSRSGTIRESVLGVVRRKRGKWRQRRCWGTFATASGVCVGEFWGLALGKMLYRGTSTTPRDERAKYRNRYGLLPALLSSLSSQLPTLPPFCFVAVSSSSPVTEFLRTCVGDTSRAKYCTTSRPAFIPTSLLLCRLFLQPLCSVVCPGRLNTDPSSNIHIPAGLFLPSFNPVMTILFLFTSTIPR